MRSMLWVDRAMMHPGHLFRKALSGYSRDDYDPSLKSACVHLLTSSYRCLTDGFTHNFPVLRHPVSVASPLCTSR